MSERKIPKKAVAKKAKKDPEDNIIRLPPRGLDAGGRLKSGPGMANGVIEVQTWHEMDAEGNFTGRTELRERYAPPPERRCNALINNLEWKGNRCVRWTIKGGNVCPSHGGSLPEVKKAAQHRLAMAADRASARLIHIALSKKGVADKDRIKALTEILDRAGVQGKTTIEVEIKPWQKMLQRIQGAIEDGRTIEAQEGVDFWVPDEEPPADDEE